MTDYDCVVAFKNGDERGFNNLFKKYHNYIKAYAWSIYIRVSDCEAEALEDIQQNLIIKCLLNQLNNIDVERLQPNFNFNVFLSGYLKSYTKYYIDKYRKKGHVLSYDQYKESEREITKFSVKIQMEKSLSYNPTDTYIEQLETSKDRIKKQLSKKEDRLFKYVEKGYTLEKIGNKLGVSTSKAFHLKKDLKEKCYNILEA
jgi:hypothetical protein